MPALGKLYNLSDSLSLYNGYTNIYFIRMLSHLGDKQKVFNLMPAYIVGIFQKVIATKNLAVRSKFHPLPTLCGLED